MTTIYINEKVEDMNDLFIVIAEKLKIGKSCFSGYDEFYDSMFHFLNGTDGIIKIYIYDNIKAIDKNIIFEIIESLNFDLEKERVSIAWL